jgi:hypothetical protein
MPSVLVMAALGVGLPVLLAWRAGARRARRRMLAARAGAGVTSLLGRVVRNAALIVLVQWIIIGYGRSGILLAVVLGLPALFASYTVTRALSVSTRDLPRRRGTWR